MGISPERFSKQADFEIHMETTQFHEKILWSPLLKQHEPLQLHVPVITTEGSLTCMSLDMGPPVNDLIPRRTHLNYSNFIPAKT